MKKIAKWIFYRVALIGLIQSLTLFFYVNVIGISIYSKEVLFTKNGQEVILLGVSHIGERDYYETIQKRYNNNYLILLEGINSDDDEPTEEITHEHSAKILGLSNQDKSFLKNYPHKNVDIKNKRISIPKFKQGIKARIHRTIPKKGTIKTSTVSMNPSGQYFISILVEEPIKEKKYKKPTMKNSVGIDLGIKDFATFSNGEKIENPRYLKKNLKKLKKEQRKLSRKAKGSNNRNKQRIKVARLHNKITNMRNDFIHKLTTKLVSENQAICLEDLNVKGMIKNHNLAQAISDVSWSKFNTLLEYKAEWHSVSILRIGRFDPSSKMCSCGVINQDLKLSDRTWTCNECGATHDRDVLASQNIQKFAIQAYKNKIGQGLSKLTPVESKSLDPQRSRKPTHQS